jgi:type III restriction enzyme
VPTKTENAPIVGQAVIHDLADLKRRRESAVAFLIAKLTLEKYFRADGLTAASRRRGEERRVGAAVNRPLEHRFTADVQAWRFPQLLEITREWLATCMKCKDNAFPQLLLLIELAHDAADRIYQAIVDSDNTDPGRKILQPVLQPYDAIGHTHGVDFSTTRNTYATAKAKCHISHVVADTGTWEQKVAQALADMAEVIRYVKNDHLGFTIPYTLNGVERSYYPDFLVHLDDGHGPDDPLQLVLECTGAKKKEKAAKVATGKHLWTPAVNNSGDFGRWEFYEARDQWNLATELRALLRERLVNPGVHAGLVDSPPGGGG